MAPKNHPEWTIVGFIFNGPWWTNRGEATQQTLQLNSSLSRITSPGILILNIMLILPLLTSVANGLDSSLVNGMNI